MPGEDKDIEFNAVTGYFDARKAGQTDSVAGVDTVPHQWALMEYLGLRSHQTLYQDESMACAARPLTLQMATESDPALSAAWPNDMENRRFLYLGSQWAGPLCR